MSDASLHDNTEDEEEEELVVKALDDDTKQESDLSPSSNNEPNVSKDQTHLSPPQSDRKRSVLTRLGLAFIRLNDYVELNGLAVLEYNGQRGWAIRQPVHSRFEVLLDSGELVRVKEVNLIKLDKPATGPPVRKKKPKNRLRTQLTPQDEKVDTSKQWSKNTLIEGWLCKRGEQRQNWKMRYFVCLPHKLQYFKVKKPGSEPLGEIMLTPATIVGVDRTSEKHVLSIMSEQGSRRFLMLCESEEMLKMWLDVLLARVGKMVMEWTEIQKTRKQAETNIAKYKRSVASREVYNLVQEMQSAAPFSMLVDQLWVLSKQFELEGDENQVLGLLLKHLYAIFSRNNTKVVCALQCQCEKDTKDRCPVVVLKAFAFNQGSEVLTRLWVHLVGDTPNCEIQPEGDFSTHEWLIRLMWLISELENYDLFASCPGELDIAGATKVHVEDVLVRDECALYSIRIHIGFQVWYVEKTFAELRVFANELAKIFRAKWLIKAFPTRNIGSVDISTMIKRVHAFNEYFQLLQGPETWGRVVGLPAFRTFFEITSNLRLSRYGENTWSKYVRAIQIGSQLGHPAVMCKTVLVLFEILCGHLPAREERVQTWVMTQLSSFCLSGPKFYNLSALELLLKVLPRCPPTFAIDALTCVQLMLGNRENNLKLSAGEGWPVPFLPFLTDWYHPPRLPTTRECRNAAVGFQGSLRVQISVKCRNLLRMDALSKSDPVVELYLRNRDGRLCLQEGNERTEVIQNSHDPDFITRFFVEYNPFAIPRQELFFMVYDSDGGPLKRVDRMGYVVVNLHDLIAGRITEHRLQILFFGGSSSRPKDDESLDLGGKMTSRDVARLGKGLSVRQSGTLHTQESVRSRGTAPGERPTIILFVKPQNDDPPRVPRPKELEVMPTDPTHPLARAFNNIVKLGNEETALYFAHNSRGAESVMVLSAIVLTTRRILVISNDQLIVDVWREDVATVRLYSNNTQLEIGTWTGTTSNITVFHSSVAFFLTQVLQLDSSSAIVMREDSPGEPWIAMIADPVKGQPAVEQKLTDEQLKSMFSLSMSILASVIYYHFTIATAKRRKEGSCALVLFETVNAICDELDWVESAVIAVCSKLLLTVLSLMLSRQRNFRNDHEAREWQNVFRMCGAFEKLMAYKPFPVGSPSRIAKQRRRLVRNGAGLPLFDPSCIPMVCEFLDRLGFQQFDPELAVYTCQRSKAHLVHLKNKGLKEVQHWQKLLALHTSNGGVSSPRMAKQSQIYSRTAHSETKSQIHRESSITVSSASSATQADDEGDESSDFDELEQPEETPTHRARPTLLYTGTTLSRPTIVE